MAKPPDNCLEARSKGFSMVVLGNPGAIKFENLDLFWHQHRFGYRNLSGSRPTDSCFIHAPAPCGARIDIEE